MCISNEVVNLEPGWLLQNVSMRDCLFQERTDVSRRFAALLQSFALGVGTSR